MGCSMRMLMTGLFILGLLVQRQLDAQDGAPFTATDGAISLQVPEGWTVMEEPGSSPNIPRLQLYDEMNTVYLYLFNILPECGGPRLGPTSPYISCDPSEAEALAYFLQYIYGYSLLPEADAYETHDGLTYAFVPGHFYAGAKDAGNGTFIIVVVWPNWDTADPLPQPEIVRMLQSATLAEPESATFPVAQMLEDGWTLDLSGLEAGPVQRLVAGADGLLYALTDAQTIFVVTSEGEILHSFSNPYLLFVRDFAVDPAGEFWVIGDALYHLDSSGDFIGQIMLDPSGNYDPIQIEAGLGGNLYLLAQAFYGGSAELRILTSELEMLGQFNVYDVDGFSFDNESFLSMALLGLSPREEIYVYSEWGAIRVFAADGTILEPFLLQDMYIQGFGFSDEAVYLLQARAPQWLRMDAAGESTMTLPASSRISVVLPSGDLLWSDGFSLTRSAWRSDE